MNPIFSSDLKLMMADFGQAVVWGAYSTTGILSVSTQDFVSEGGLAIVRGETLELAYPAADLPGLKAKAILSVGGVDHRVKHVDLEGDGLVAHAYLELA